MTFYVNAYSDWAILYPVSTANGVLYAFEDKCHTESAAGSIHMCHTSSPETLFNSVGPRVTTERETSWKWHFYYKNRSGMYREWNTTINIMLIVSHSRNLQLHAPQHLRLPILSHTQALLPSHLQEKQYVKCVSHPKQNRRQRNNGSRQLLWKGQLTSVRENARWKGQ